MFPVAVQYQTINEILAKGVETEDMPFDISQEVEAANLFLINKKGNKPKWLDDFLESNKCKLVETICRATSVKDGISSLRGYNEGYFNEIVQNANDLHAGETIMVSVERMGSICKVECQYADKGFQLSNIYGFLNREMSDKSTDKGQTGKFGVGIKSFFKFVNTLVIESNVLFDFRIKRLPNDVHITGNVSMNPEWDQENTKVLFEYDADDHSEFNTKKFTRLIDCLCGNNHDDIKEFFVSAENEKLVFDICSLIFMQLKNTNVEERKAISRICFKGSEHTVEILCDNIFQLQRIKCEDRNWRIGNVCLKIIYDKLIAYEKNYVIFEQADMTFGFPTNTDLTDENRIYATYYLKTDLQHQILPISMLANTNYANIHRTDVGDSEDTIRKVYKQIKEKMLKLYSCMCSEEMLKLPCINEVSDVFHALLARYLFVDRTERMESPLNNLEIDNYHLPKLTHESQPYVVVHQPKEKYEKCAFVEGDIVKELKESYLDFVEENAVLDYEILVENPLCLPGVSKVYTAVYNEIQQTESYYFTNVRSIAKCINFFESVAAFIVFKVSGEKRENCHVTDAEIDRWLLQLQKKTGKYFDPMIFLKLIGRYELNSAIEPDGSIIERNLSFKDYLFNGISELEEGFLVKYQNRQFDEKYFELKKELLRKRYVDTGNKKDKYVIRCIQPCGRSVNGWDGTYDYYGMSSSDIDHQPLSQPQLLLEKIATDPSFRDVIYADSMRLFEKRAKGMWKRWEYSFKNSRIVEQQIIDISCLKNICLQNFYDFVEAVKHRKNISQKLSTKIRITCNQENITTQNVIHFLLPLMTEVREGEKRAYLLDEFDKDDVVIGNVIENTNNEVSKENLEFILKISGYTLHLYRFESNTRRKMTAYFGEGKFAIKTGASASFSDVARYTSSDKHVYIFYDNFDNDVWEAIAIVLGELDISKKTLELLQGYIHNGNTTKTMNYFSRRRTIAKVKKKLVLDWRDMSSTEVLPIYDNEVLYRLLTARGSYDIFCPICADIPLKAFDYFEETKNKHSRKIIVLENENIQTNSKVPYIITVACPYCFERLKNTLIKSEFDGKNLILTTQIAHGQHEKMKNKQQIELSPINIELMNKFKM